MAAIALAERRRAPVRYRRLLVPISAHAESVRAFEIACRLAADNRASIAAVAVIEVPPLLPLDAHMLDDEEAARELLERVRATGEAYGVKVDEKLVRARDGAAALVEQAIASRTELIVIGAARATLRQSRHWVASGSLHEVLAAAPCRVLVVSEPAQAA